MTWIESLHNCCWIYRQRPLDTRRDHSFHIFWWLSLSSRLYRNSISGSHILVRHQMQNTTISHRSVGTRIFSANLATADWTLNSVVLDQSQAANASHQRRGFSRVRLHAFVRCKHEATETPEWIHVLLLFENRCHPIQCIHSHEREQLKKVSVLP